MKEQTLERIGEIDCLQQDKEPASCGRTTGSLWIIGATRYEAKA